MTPDYRGKMEHASDARPLPQREGSCHASTLANLEGCLENEPAKETYEIQSYLLIYKLILITE